MCGEEGKACGSQCKKSRRKAAAESGARGRELAMIMDYCRQNIGLGEWRGARSANLGNSENFRKAGQDQIRGRSRGIVVACTRLMILGC